MVAKPSACIALGLAAIVLVGCSRPPAPSSEEAMLSGDVHTRQAYAVAAAANGDRSHLDILINSLESDEPSERLIALRVLERLTGTTIGYRFYDPPDRRREAVAIWRRALANGQLTANTSPGQVNPPVSVER